MKVKTHEARLEALDAGIMKSREEIAAFTADVKKLTELRPNKSSKGGDHLQEGPTNGGKRNGVWTGFRHTLDEAGVQGGKITKGLADEIKRHPLLGSVAAFGLGFAVAALVFKRSGKDSGR